MARLQPGAQGGRWGWKLVFWLYLCLLVVFVVIKFDGRPEDLLLRMESARQIRAAEPGYNLNLIPFASIRVQLRRFPSPWSVRNLLGNVLAFVPLGYLLPRAHRRFPAWLTLPCALVFICAIEVFQYVTLLGSCDVDDLILNLAGSAAGWLVYLLTRRRTERG